jgi:hypothetical protein
MPPHRKANAKRRRAFLIACASTAARNETLSNLGDDVMAVGRSRVREGGTVSIAWQ